MKHILFTILFASSLLATTQQSAQKQAQERILAMSVDDARMELQDNFARATEEQLSEIFDESVLNWQPSEADVKAAMGGDWAQFKKIFACPTSKSPDFYPMLYNVNFKAGAITCLIYPAYDGVDIQERAADPAIKTDQEPLLFTKTLDHVAGYATLDFSAARENRAREINQAREEARAFRNAHYTQLNTTDGRLNQIDLLIASALSDSDIIDIEATEAAGMMVLRPEYHSYQLGGTEIVKQSASETSWSDTRGFISSAKWLLNRGSFGAIETQVEVEKQLDKMSMKIDDATDLMSSRSANMAIMFNAFSEASAFWFWSVVTFAFVFGAGTWLYQSFDHEDKMFKFSKGWPIAALAGFLLFFPAPANQMESLQSNYQKLEKFGYGLTNGWANDLAKVFIEKELNTIKNQVGYFAVDQIVRSEAERAQASKLTHFWGYFVDKVCWPEYSHSKKQNFGNDFSSKFGPERLENQSNIFGSTTERVNIFAASVVGYRPYTVHKNGEMAPAAPYTLSFCANAYEKYNHSRARSQKFNTALSSGNATLNVAEVEKLVSLQAGLFNDWGWPAVLSLPLLKMRLENEGKITKPSDVATGGGDDESLVKDFTRWSVYYMLPGASKIADLASIVLSPLKKIPYIGELIAGGGGAAIAIFAMGKILAALPVIIIILFGSVRLCIIIVKIFFLHLVTPFMLISVLLNRGKMNDATSFTAKVFATMLEIPLFVTSVYGLIVFQDIFSGVATKMSMALNTFYLSAASEDAWQWLENIGYYSISAILEVALMLLSIVISWAILFKFHTFILNQIELRTESTLEDITESAVNSARNWNSKI